MLLQGGNEGADTDAEIERIKSEIELEQKNKQTLGGMIIIMMVLIKVMLIVIRITSDIELQNKQTLCNRMCR